MEQGKLTYALFFAHGTWALANIHRTKVIPPPHTHTHTPPFILIDIQGNNYNYKLEKQKHFYSL